MSIISYEEINGISEHKKGLNMMMSSQKLMNHFNSLERKKELKRNISDNNEIEM
ncbi:MAG: hypothetical protein HG467_001560 [Clostridiales bacterium]|nr:hypothetical protein [Clostridiales bacterium]